MKDRRTGGAKGLGGLSAQQATIISWVIAEHGFD